MMIPLENYKTTYVSIEEFYSGKSVFITGGAGFVGKALIEKLVYSCPDLKNIYVLIRKKKGVSVQHRMKAIFESEIFSRLKAEKPENMKKLVPITGDITLDGLGLAEEDKILLQNEVSVVFHLAAAIRFNQPLSEAMGDNVEGTRTVIHFSQQIKNLKTFLYMSTAFSHTNLPVLEEIVYPSPMKIDDVYEFLKENGNDAKRLKDILRDRPNTYTFTKALTESLVDEIHGDMPTVIIRPSIVVTALKEPFRGWTDSWVGPAPAIKALAKGYIHTFYGKGHYNFAIIPVDYVVNATIVAAAKCQRSTKLKVFNCCTSTTNPVSIYQTRETIWKESTEKKYNDFPLFGVIITKSSILLYITELLFQKIPAYILDFLLILKKEPTRYVKIQQRLSGYLRMMRFFTSRSWLFKCTRLEELAKDLDQIDREKFPIVPTGIHCSEFISAFVHGVFNYLASK